MFYHYSQNNSGGSFTGPAINVIVEAANAESANALAEVHGLYFDGFGDCPCCGYRWSSQWKNDKGDKVPSIYSEPLTDPPNVKYDWSTNKIPYAIVYYLDGTEKVFKTIQEK